MKVVNMTIKGCRVRHTKTLWIGEQVELELPERARIRATVRWSLLGNAGLNFASHEDA